jgi:hypothetical protein
MAENDIEHEERPVGKGKDETKRLPAEAHIGQQRATRQRQAKRQKVASRANTSRRQNDLA